MSATTKITFLIMVFTLLALVAIVVYLPEAIAAGRPWRSVLYPEDWGVCYADSEGRFLQDYSFAGYHAGTRPLPTDILTPVVDVTQAPYFADPTGVLDATAAIQAAIDDVGASGGGTVYLPAGQYRLRVPSEQRFALGIPYSNVRFVGAGPDKTFLHLDETNMRDKDVIRVYGRGNWRNATSVPLKISESLTYPTQIIPFEGVARLNPGDWIVITHDTTSAWIEEHNMADLWREGAIPGATMYRQVTAIDTDSNTLTVDAPIRYYLLPRDNARIYRVDPHVEEVGLSNFSIGMTEHPGSGFEENAYQVSGTAAFDIHHSHAIRFIHVVNSWVRNIKSFRPQGNNHAHILSNGLLLSHSRFITVDQVEFWNPQYLGGGGNGYHFTLVSNDSLIRNSAAYNARHNYDFKQAISSGNVIHQSYSHSPSGIRSDFHMHLSPSNLIDGVTLDQDRFDAGWRGGSGGATPHGLTTTLTTFWNIIGEAYMSRFPGIVYSEQYGWGYVIGTTGAAHTVRLGTNPRTLPEDYVEGIGDGHRLAPQSLYLDQLQRRLQRDEIIHCPELDFRPPMPRIDIQKPHPNERVKGILPLDLTVDDPPGRGRVTQITVTLNGTTLFRGVSLPGQLEINTKDLADGRHRLMVEARASNGLSGRQSVSFVVSNIWRFDDPLDAPTFSTWFGELSRDRTVEISDGWTYDTSSPELFFNDKGRRVRIGDREEYLVWETPALSRFTVSFYTRVESMSHYVKLEVSDGTSWHPVPFNVNRVQRSASGWMEVVATGEVDDGLVSDRFRLTILPGIGDPGDIQVGEVNFTGWNL